LVVVVAGLPQITLSDNRIVPPLNIDGCRGTLRQRKTGPNNKTIIKLSGDPVGCRETSWMSLWWPPVSAANCQKVKMMHQSQLGGIASSGLWPSSSFRMDRDMKGRH
jgi:hypothetical protein